MFNFQNRIIQLNEMYTELKRSEKQIGYDSEEVQLKDQLAWARVYVSEEESTTLDEQIAKKEEVVRIFTECLTFLMHLMHSYFGGYPHIHNICSHLT